MNPTDFLTGPAAVALGWTLLHALWQGFALVLPAALVMHLLRNRSSILRYRVGALTLLLQVIASGVTFSHYYVPATGSARSVSAAFTSAKVLAPLHWQPLSWPEQTRYFLESHLSEFVLIYLIGITLFGLRLAGGWLYLHRLTRSAGRIAAPQLASLTERLRLTMTVRSVVQVRESARVAVPVVIGVLKPVMLLPIGLMAHLSTAELEMVLAHELAHVKRADYGINLLQSVVEVLYFFHPALWWLSARVREEREHCCDDLAVRVCGNNGRLLAQALAHVEEFRLTQSAPAPTLAVALTNKPQLLLHRVRRALGMPVRSFVSNRSLAGITLVTLLLLSLSVYAVQQQQPKPKPKGSKSLVTPRRSPSTDLHFDANRQLTGIVWKGQKLSTTRVAALQHQLDQIMAGELNLDAVGQPDRDILLAIIEAQYGMQQSANRVAEVVDSVRINGVWVNSAEAIQPDPVIFDARAMSADAGMDMDIPLVIDQHADAATDTIVQPEEYKRDYMAMLRNQDSLDQQRAVNNEKIAVLKAKVREQEFAVEAVERNVERLERQKYFLEQRRLTETSLQRQLVFKIGPGNADSTRQRALKQIETRETSIRKVETEIETLNKQLLEVANELAKAHEPLRDTEEQIRKLQLLGSYQAMSYIMPHATPVPAQPLRGTLRGVGAVAPTRSARAIRETAAIPTPPAAPPAAAPAAPKAAKSPK